MSAAGQICLIQHLTDAASVAIIAKQGLAPEVIPDEALRPVVTFAVDYWYQSGQTKAPSVAAFLAEPLYADALNDAEIDIDEEPEDSIEWALDDLKGSYLIKEADFFNRQFAISVREATFIERPAAVATGADALITLSMKVARRDDNADVRGAMTDRLLSYDARVANRDVIEGMTFGMDLVDRYTNGIKPGELAVVAAGPKIGKSFFLDWVALREWQRGKCVTLYSLENTVEMTLDRIACLANNVSYRNWQCGACTEIEIERVRAWVADIPNAAAPFYILRPPTERRKVVNLVRDALVRETESLLIDQLSHIVHENPRLRYDLQVTESIKTLSDMISTGRRRVPCLLAHQINREGVKAAFKRGYYEMSDLADSAGVERGADWVFGLYQSLDQRSARPPQALLQTMAVRREDLKHFSMIWNIEGAHFIARCETNLGGS